MPEKIEKLVTLIVTHILIQTYLHTLKVEQLLTRLNISFLKYIRG